MNIEQLQLILEAVQAAGEGAFTIAIIWFVKDFLSMVIVYTVVPCTVYYVIKLILINMKGMMYSYFIANSIRGKLGYSMYGDFSSTEKAKMERVVDRITRDMGYDNDD